MKWEGRPQSDNVYFGTSWGEQIWLDPGNPTAYSDAVNYNNWMNTNDWF